MFLAFVLFVGVGAFPAQVAAGGSVVSVPSGDAGVLGSLSSGEVDGGVGAGWLWGPVAGVGLVVNRSVGSNVVWPSDLFQTVNRSATYAAVSAGGGHSCGVRTDGSIVCWGTTSLGRLRHRGFVHPGFDRRIAFVWGADRWFDCLLGGQQLWGGCGAGGFVHSGFGRCVSFVWGADRWFDCLLGEQREWGAVVPGVRSLRFRPVCFFVWGADRWFDCLLGDNSYGQAEAPGGSFTQISAGRRHSCGLRVDGSIVCWGDNSYGQAEARGGRSPRFQLAGGIRVGCGWMVRLSAGGATIMGRLRCRGVRSLRFRPANCIRVGCGQMVRLSAGTSQCGVKNG